MKNLYFCFCSNILPGEVTDKGLSSQGVPFIEVRCMASAGDSIWKWPIKDDIFKYLEMNVLRKINCPVPHLATYRYGRNETYIFEM